MTSASVGELRQLETLGGVQHVGHLVRVVLVHLAAKGSDVQLAAHVVVLRQRRQVVEGAKIIAASDDERRPAVVPL